jgi:hypothetical protein
MMPLKRNLPLSETALFGTTMAERPSSGAFPSAGLMGWHPTLQATMLHGVFTMFKSSLICAIFLQYVSLHRKDGLPQLTHVLMVEPTFGGD